MPDYDLLTRRLDHIPDIQRAIIGRLDSGHPLYMLSYGAGARRIILSAGIHGDEPAGVEALLRFVEGVNEDGDIRKWQKECQFTILPCTNPTGYERGTRENMDGIDLNRRFGSEDPLAEVGIIQRALTEKRFDLYMDFHEDMDGEGFYLYEVLGKGSNHLSRDIIENVSRRYPVDMRERIDGFPNCGGVICPQREGKRFPVKRSNLPLPLYLYLHGVCHCLTIESPVSLSMEDRIGMHLMALHVVLRRYAAR